MIFRETGLRGAYLVVPERLEDERGYFARTWCAREFGELGLETSFSQCNTSFNPRAGTLRGLHYQIGEGAEAKLIRCIRGRIFDVIVDLRPDSPTYRGWFATELNEENGHMVYAPGGFAHGFQTLADGSEVFYQISAPYRPELARGVRWDDPSIGIVWPPAEERIISARDRALPLLAAEASC